jgi:long-chain acyl-CoA synthetase
MNLTDIFCQTVQQRPDHPAIIGPGQHDVYTYSRLLKEIEFLANRLKNAGLEPGSTVGLHYPSGREYIVLTYALWHCRVCVVPIAFELASEEKRMICQQISLDAIVSKAEANSRIEFFQHGEYRLIFNDIVVAPGNEHRDHPSGFSNLNVAFLRFSSGTTARSKGVVLSHETIWNRIQAATPGLHISPDDRIISLMSMSYHFAVSIGSFLSFGATIILCRDHFGGTIVRSTMENNGTVIYGSPIHYGLMARARGSNLIPSVRLAISTATYLPSEIASAFFEKFKIPLSDTYGIIEVGLPCINFDKAREKPSSVGRVLPAYEILMEDIGLGDEVKAIKLRGQGLLDAYYIPWQTHREIMQDGWFDTGDLGRLDEQNYLYIVGRSKDVINVAGMKVFPQEIESVLRSHPMVKEAYVFGREHHRWGEIPHAQVVLRNDAGTPLTGATLIEYCRRYLTPFKVPEKIEIVSTLTKTASGKIVRRGQK